MRAFTKSVLVITLFALATRLIGFVFRIIMSRILGAELLGVYQMSMSIFMVLLTVISTGLPLVMSREVAKAKDKVLDITLSGLVVGVVTALVLCLTVLAGQSLFGLIFTDRRSLTILFALLPAVLANSVYATLRAVWWGEKKFFLLGLTELVEQVARVILFVVLLGVAYFFADLAHLAAWAFSGSCVVSAVLVVVIFLKAHRFNRHQRRPSLIKPILRSAAPITGVRVISSMAFPIISILLPLRLVAAGWTNAAAVAQYGVVVGMTFPLLTIPSTVVSALATALVPELSALVNQGEWTAVQRQVQTVIKFTVFVNFIFIPVFLALGCGIGEFLYADATSGVYLARSAWVMVPLSLSQITNTTLNSLNQENLSMRNYLIGSSALFAAIWFLPAVIGADAVLVGLGLSLTISTALNLHAIRRFTHATTRGATLGIILRYVGITLPAFAIGATTFAFANGWALFWALVLAGTVTCAAFFGLAWATNLIILPKKRA